MSKSQNHSENGAASALPSAYDLEVGAERAVLSGQARHQVNRDARLAVATSR